MFRVYVLFYYVLFCCVKLSFDSFYLLLFTACTVFTTNFPFSCGHMY